MTRNQQLKSFTKEVIKELAPGKDEIKPEVI